VLAYLAITRRASSSFSAVASRVKSPNVRRDFYDRNPRETSNRPALRDTEISANETRGLPPPRSLTAFALFDRALRRNSLAEPLRSSRRFVQCMTDIRVNVPNKFRPRPPLILLAADESISSFAYSVAVRDRVSLFYLNQT